ncbi:MAG TPA: hypothetical protein DCZ72_06130 [Armatimonadetes bacterium]|nr:hypothetical protein [Armatimonadota bacterium]
MGVPKVLVVSDDQLSTLDPALGFDDFVVEPFAPEALLARFRLLRHRQAHGPRGGLLTHGPLRLDLAAYRADLANEPLDLTPLEFELLCFLAAHPGIVYSREKLLSMVWPEGTQAGTRTIDVHVRRLRAKLGDDHDSLIQTVHGVGYRFVELDDRRY